MKSSELQIGDWVKIIYRKEKTKVTSVRDGMIDTRARTMLTENEFAPILITTDFLEKNGFIDNKERYKGFFDFYYISKDRRVIVTERGNSGDGCWNVHIDNEYFSTIGSCDVRYVHEMQHLLRLCNYEMNIVV